ncbi:MAG: LTA synthase family protein, partial [Alistipes sp.]|nr:LTA synthase family protein [Alistipes sp.]
MKIKLTKLKEFFFKSPVSDYLLLTLAFYIALQVLNLCFEPSPSSRLFVSHIHRIVDAMMFALPIFILRRKLFLFPYLLVVDLYFLANVWYYRTYLNPMPLAAFTMVENLDGLWVSIFQSMRLIDLGIFLPIAAFAVYYAINRTETKRGFSIICFAAFTVFVCAGWAFPYFTRTGKFNMVSCLNQLSMTRVIQQYGFASYWYCQIAYTKECSDADKQFAEDMMRQIQSAPAPEPLVAQHNKNLIVILVESLATYPIGLEIDGVEVTPRLNGFIRDSQTLYFPKVWPCRRDGRSSDAQLLINTGLLPIANGATASLFGENSFYSLPKA